MQAVQLLGVLLQECFEYPRSAEPLRPALHAVAKRLDSASTSNETVLRDTLEMLLQLHDLLVPPPPPPAVAASTASATAGAEQQGRRNGGVPAADAANGAPRGLVATPPCDLFLFCACCLFESCSRRL